MEHLAAKETDISLRSQQTTKCSEKESWFLTVCQSGQKLQINANVDLSKKLNKHTVEMLNYCFKVL